MVGREPQEEIRWESRGQAVGGLVIRVKSRGLRFNWKLISVFFCFFLIFIYLAASGLIYLAASCCGTQAISLQHTDSLAVACGLSS